MKNNLQTQRNYFQTRMKFTWTFILILILTNFWINPKAFAGSKELSSLNEEQTDEKQDLESMKRELSSIKQSINEGLDGLNKVDTKALKELQEFHLICKTACCEIAPGKTIECYTYNGILPGPTIKVKEGQLVRLIVHNQLNTATSLDLHGMSLPASVDGLPSPQAGLIAPGESYVYQFVAKPIGTYWYHPQIMHSDQKAKGMYGAFIVEPSGPPVKSADQDIALILGTMTVTKTGAESTPKPIAEPRPASSSPHQNNLFARPRNNYNKQAMVEQTARADASTATYTATSPTGHYQSVFYLVNGKTAPYIPSIEVNPNSRVRLRVINSGQHSIPLHLTGHKFQLVSLNGNLTSEQTARDTMTLGVSDRAELEFTADNPGTWTLASELIEQSTNNGKFPGGIAVLLKYLGN